MIKIINILLLAAMTLTFFKPCNDLELIENSCAGSNNSSVVDENNDNCIEDCCEKNCLCFCCNFNFVAKFFTDPERFVNNKELLIQNTPHYISQNLLSVWQPPKFC